MPMYIITLLCSLLLQLSPAVAGNESHGGDTVAVPWPAAPEVGRLFSLDLVEYGLAPDASLFGDKDPMQETHLLDGFSLFEEPATTQYAAIKYIDRTSSPFLPQLKDVGEQIFANDTLGSPDSSWFNSRTLRKNFVNKLYQIRTVEPAYADLLEKKALHLSWYLVSAPLAKVKNPETPIDTENLFRVARYDEGEIRISRQGWSQRVKLSPGFVMDPLDDTNRVALLLHEVVCAVFREDAKSEDFKTSRKAVAKLFTRTLSAKGITESWKLVEQALASPHP